MVDFYDATQLEQIAINLFYGWGYNFYRIENQLRADDLLIRSKAGWLLGLARAALDEAERSYRRTLPPPSRANPRPDPAALHTLQALEDLSRAIGRMDGLIRALPVPENDRMTQRYRDETQTLWHLNEIDTRLIAQAKLLGGLLEGKSAQAIIEAAADIESGLAAIAATLQQRQGLLL